MRLFTTFIMALLCNFCIQAQTLDIQISWDQGGCTQNDTLNVVVGGFQVIGEIIGEYNYTTFNHFCETAPDTLTGTVEVFEKSDGTLAFTDFSFGLWPACYGIDPPTGSLNFSLVNNMITPLNGTDNYGDIWEFESFTYSNNSYMISFSNTYGEFGSVILEPTDGRMIPDLSGGETPIGDYAYLWSTGDTSSSIIIDGLENTYSVTVTDEGNNSGMANIEVEYSHPLLDELEAFYIATNGDNWVDNSGWKAYMDGTPICGPCDWAGINCNEFDRIESINLSANNLEGDVSDILMLFPEILRLTFNFNNLSGEIPSNIGDLPFLNSLSLFDNDISGVIPESLGNLPLLTNLNLGNNNLTGEIPASLGNLEFIFFMNLEANELTGSIPQSFAGLDVIRLGLSFNELTGPIPMPLGNPQLTRSIAASHNRLSGDLEDMFEAYDRLSFLSLINNNLTGEIPPSLLNNEVIESLYLTNNNFSGCYSNNKTADPCLLEFNDNDTLIEIKGEMFAIYFEPGYNFTNNPLLPWQGDYERLCNGEDQIGAPCDDGDAMTSNDIITDDCSCAGEFMSAVRDLEGIAINIYPNPIASVLYVEAEQSQNLEAELLNLMGQTLMSIEFNAANDIQHLDAGTYLLSIQSDSGKRIVERLIKP